MVRNIAVCAKTLTQIAFIILFQKFFLKKSTGKSNICSVAAINSMFQGHFVIYLGIDLEFTFGWHLIFHHKSWVMFLLIILNNV